MNSRPCPPVPVASNSRSLTAILLLGLAATAATAQQVTTSGDAPVVSSYSGPRPTPQPLPDESLDRGPSLGPAGRPASNDLLPGQWYNRGDQDPGSFPEPSTRRSPGPFFLPALLPVLGGTPPAQPAPLAASSAREFAGESFSMAYGNLAANHEVSAKRNERIARYRATRLALLTELRDQLSRGTDASGLAALAAAQGPRLLELEAEAENIRHDLTHGGLVRNTADDIGRLTPTGETPVHRADLALMRRLLSAAHFQDGFSPDQRRLLEEMALQTLLVIEPEPATTIPPPIFFWPAGVRLAPPSHLPPEVAARLKEFQRRKSALKDELRAALDRENTRRFNLGRTEAHARLGAAQAPRFAELDQLADEIRPALADGHPRDFLDRDHDYVAAAFASGLSPAQRRLLLAAAANARAGGPAATAGLVSAPITATER